MKMKKMKRNEETRDWSEIHEEIMETVVTTMQHRGSNFKILTSEVRDSKFVTLPQKEIKKNRELGLKFGDLVMLNNQYYTGTLAMYLGYFSDPITPNNRVKQHWFQSQNEVRPHYYGDGRLINKEDLINYGVRRVIPAKPYWVNSFIWRAGQKFK